MRRTKFWARVTRRNECSTRIVAALQRTERGKVVLGKMAVALAEQSSFPDLRNWEDSESKISAAMQAVGELKSCIAKQREKSRTSVKLKLQKKRLAWRERLSNVAD